MSAQPWMSTGHLPAIDRSPSPYRNSQFGSTSRDMQGRSTPKPGNGGTGFVRGIPFARSASPGKLHKVNPARGLFDDYKPVLNVDLSDVDLSQHDELDGRDFLALLGLPPEASSAEVDTRFYKLRHDWDAGSVAQRYEGRHPKELRQLEATYLEMEQLLRKAYTLLSYGSVRNSYSEHLRRRDELLEEHLDDWMLELDNVHPVPCSRCFGMLRGCLMRMLDSVVMQDGVLQGWYFTDKKGSIRSKKGPLKVKNIVAVFNQHAGAAEEGKPANACAVLFQLNSADAGPGGQLRLVPCNAKEAQDRLEGHDPLCVVVQDDIGTAVTYRSQYTLQDMENGIVTTEMAEGGEEGTPFFDISESVRYDRVCSNLAALTRYVVFHIEQSQGLRVLKVQLEFVTDINGLFFFKRVVHMFCCSRQPWISPNYEPTHQLAVVKSDFEGTTAWFPDSPGGTFSDEQLRGTWPALGQLPPASPRRARSELASNKTSFDIEPSWKNEFARTVRLRPKKAMVRNFISGRGTHPRNQLSKSNRRGLSERELQESISLNAQIIRHPFMPLQTSCSVPGRHLKPAMLSLVKPWEYTARPSRSVLWTPPHQKKMRQPDDPYGLELRVLSKKTGFPLEECYEIYSRMGEFANTFQGFRDRDITRSNPCNFTEDEFETFLRRCGVRKRMVARRMFNAFMHPIGFGRKKRHLLAFKDAVYGLCAFGIGKKATQAEALFKIMDASGDGSVTRAELLAFMTVMLPDGLVLPKIESFKRVSEIFQCLDEDGGGELEAAEFVRGVCDNKEVYDRIQDMSPFKRYFHVWDHKAVLSLSNIIAALDAPVPLLKDDPLVVMLEMLTKRCRAVFERVKEMPHEDELHPDLLQPFLSKQTALDLLLEIGVKPEWAQQEIDTIPDRPDGNLNGEAFVKLLVGTAEMNPLGFEALEARYKQEDEKREMVQKNKTGAGRVKVDVTQATVEF